MLSNLVESPLFCSLASDNRRGVFVWNTDFDIVYLNAAARRIFGLTGEDIGRNVSAILPEEAQDKVESIRRESLATESGVWSINDNIAENRRITCLWYNKRIVMDGEPVGIVSEVEDVTHALELRDSTNDSLAEITSTLTSIRNIGGQVQSSQSQIDREIERIRSMDRGWKERFDTTQTTAREIADDQDLAHVIHLNLKIQAAKLGPVGAAISSVAERLEHYAANSITKVEKIVDGIDELDRTNKEAVALRETMVSTMEEYVQATDHILRQLGQLSQMAGTMQQLVSSYLEAVITENDSEAS